MIFCRGIGRDEGTMFEEPQQMRVEDPAALVHVAGGDVRYWQFRCVTGSRIAAQEENAASISTLRTRAYSRRCPRYASVCFGVQIFDAAHTIKHHWDGILRWFDSKIANGLIEGINSLVQAATAKARGYRSIRNLKATVYRLTGKLDLRLRIKRFCPHQTSKNHKD
jgi:hypothetical protein